MLDGFGAKAIVCDQSTRDKAHAVAEKIGVTHVVTRGRGRRVLIAMDVASIATLA